MQPCSAYKIVGYFGSQSVGLCGVLDVGLRASFRRASSATILSLALTTLILTIFTSFKVNAEVKRISSVYKDLGQSQKIYLHAGLISVIEFPQNIIEVRLGNPKSLKAQLSQVSPRELTLFLSQQAVEPTNLIVKSEKRFYIFDIIPSKTSHQDYIKIAAAFSGPKLSEVGMPTITRDLSPKKSTKPQGHLIEAIKMGGK